MYPKIAKQLIISEDNEICSFLVRAFHYCATMAPTILHAIVRFQLLAETKVGHWNADSAILPRWHSRVIESLTCRTYMDSNDLGLMLTQCHAMSPWQYLWISIQATEVLNPTPNSKRSLFSSWSCSSIFNFHSQLKNLGNYCSCYEFELHIHFETLNHRVQIKHLGVTVTALPLRISVWIAYRLVFTPT